MATASKVVQAGISSALHRPCLVRGWLIAGLSDSQVLPGKCFTLLRRFYLKYYSLS